MKIKLIYLLVVLFVAKVCADDSNLDNEFAEFEDFSDDEIVDEPQIVPQPKVQPKEQEDDGIVIEDENEFEHFSDQEEFEGYGSDTPQVEKTEPPKLTIAKVPPIHFRKNWDSYWLEMLIVSGLFAYFSNYFVGKNKNSKIANNWLQSHISLLEEQFALVGDDGKKESEGNPAGFVKEADSVFWLWCSGRTLVEGMLVELKMIKRQDLVSVLAGLMKKTRDQVQIRVELSKDSLDSFVFAVCSKKSATKMFKEVNDLNKFCTAVAKPDEKYHLPAGFSVLSEIQEATQFVLDSRVLAIINKYSEYLDYIHISDQWSRTQTEENTTQLTRPETKKMLIVNYFLPDKVDMDDMRPLLQLVIYLVEKLKKFKLSREGKNKADKNRLRIEEEYQKNSHSARAEMAAQKREEKRKQEKERIMNEEDPEKQRRWEKKEKKRQAKKQTPKLKQLSIKAL